MRVSCLGKLGSDEVNIWGPHQGICILSSKHLKVLQRGMAKCVFSRGPALAAGGDWNGELAEL